MGLQGRSPCNPMDEMMSTQTIDFCFSVGYTPRCQQKAARGFGVVVTCNFPKVEITGSTPVTRSLNDLYRCDRGRFISPLHATAPPCDSYHVRPFSIQQNSPTLPETEMLEP